MGEIADAMLDGTLCEGCGTYMGDGTGFPGYCSPQCARDRGADYAVAARHAGRGPKKPRAACTECGKIVKAVGLRDHQRDAHGKAS